MVDACGQPTGLWTTPSRRFDLLWHRRDRLGIKEWPDPWGRAFDDQDAELAAAALPPLDPPEDEPEDDPEEDDEPEDDPEEDEDPEEDDEDELSLEDDSDFAGLVAVPPAVVSEPDARESVR